MNGSELVHLHLDRNRFYTFADFEIYKLFFLFFIIVFVFGFELSREANGLLLGGSDAVEHNAVVVLVTQRHVCASALRLNLEHEGLVHLVVSGTLLHAGFVLGLEQCKSHWLGIGVDFEQVDHNITLFAVFLLVATIHCPS